MQGNLQGPKFLPRLAGGALPSCAEEIFLPARLKVQLLNVWSMAGISGCCELYRVRLYCMDFKFADLTGEEPSFELELQGAWEHTAYCKSSSWHLMSDPD